MARKIRLGIVGLGFGRYGFIPSFRGDARCEVVGICATVLERAQKVALDFDIPQAYGDYRRMIEEGNLDAIAIAVPPHIQPPIALMALEHSIAVFGEKPMADTLESAGVLYDAALRSNVAHMIDFIFPEIGVWIEARRILHQGQLGAVRHVVVQWLLESSDIRRGIRTWKTDGLLSGGVLKHFASHTLYYLEWFLGPIKELSATLSGAVDLTPPSDNMAVLCAEFTCGASASITVCNSAIFGSGHKLEFYGEKGTVVLINTTNDPVKGFRLFLGKRGQRQPEEVYMDEGFDGVSDSLDTRVAPVSRLAKRFLDWIETDVPSRPSFEEGYRVQVLLDAAVRSDQLRRRMNVS